MLYAFARSHATLSRAVLLERDAHSPARVIFERREFETYLPGQRYGALCSDGDQTLTTESAQLPPAFKQALRVEEHASQAIHSQIFNDGRYGARFGRFCALSASAKTLKDAGQGDPGSARPNNVGSPQPAARPADILVRPHPWWAAI